MKQLVQSLLRNSEGAVAPTIALSLLGLIAVGGIAFDYARMASMDTELQNAADQAALAAASQLDGQPGACARAAAAARNMITNLTLMANDGDSNAVVIAEEPECDDIGNIRFYQEVDKDPPATSDQNATFVEVQVEPRTAFYALTPVVGAFSSGSMTAIAFAGLGQAVCKSPPVMICNPTEPNNNADPDYPFDASALVGMGLALVSVGGGGGNWAPGNFGYLQNGTSTGNQLAELRKALGWTNVPGDCLPSTNVDTRTGANTPVTDALNTRFDIYEKGGPGGDACPTPGNCEASINSVKDLVRTANANSCRIGPQGWEEVSTPYKPTSATADLTSSYPTAMGYPRDKCHAVATSVAGACRGPVGDGNWDRNAYFLVNYGWTSSQWPSLTGLSSTATRYDVYRWEIENRGDNIGGKVILASRVAGGSSGNPLTDHDSPVCSNATGQGYGTGAVPADGSPDRRQITVAVVNCRAHSVNGNSTDVPVIQWVDAFLVEPSVTRNRNPPQRSTGQQDIYAEIIGGADIEGVQLVKKAVPYLIE